jgi:membrane-bound ClpP family serine protease
LLVRRQAWREQEPFWSPPARRVSEALLPPFIAGFALAVFLVLYGHAFQSLAWTAASLWIILYGCALNAAGFFTLRGLALFGRILVLIGCGLLLVGPAVPGDVPEAAHMVMGSVFGFGQTVHGLYLYFTERKRHA